VAFPIATPGLDHPGDLYRTDPVVALRSRGLRRTAALPTVAAVLVAIGERLPPPRI
jgi:formylmethanofuran dehydrogenase subunit B